MNKGTIFAIAAVILWLTCPEKEDHAEAVRDKINNMCSANASASIGLGFMKLLAGEAGIELFEAQDYKNWFVFSTAKVCDINTFGILGNVFILKN